MRLSRPPAACSWSLCIFLLSASLTFAQQVVYVDDDNCPGPGSGTDLDPFCLIQDAICDIQSVGGTVMVRPGYYNESIRMLGGVSVVSVNFRVAQ